MPALSQRSETLGALQRSSIHQSIQQSISTPQSRLRSHLIMERAKQGGVLRDPVEALDLLRSLLQKDISDKVGRVMVEFVRDYFGPAVENLKRNLLGHQADEFDQELTSSTPSDDVKPGGDSSTAAGDWLENVCCSALEHAKASFREKAFLESIMVGQTDDVVVTGSEAGTGGTKVSAAISEAADGSPFETDRKGGRRSALSDMKNGSSSSSLGGLKRKQQPYLGDDDPSSSANKPDQGGGGPPKNAKLKKRQFVGGTNSSKWPRPNTDLILISKQGKPVRREGPHWEASRLSTDTMFILGSKANKALGLGQTRGRLYMKHPELFKYSGDQEDKEWLTKNQFISTTGGKAYLMVLGDIAELSRTEEYVANPRQRPEELTGFCVPQFMVEKMQRFMEKVHTDPTVSDETLLEGAKLQIAKMEQEHARRIQALCNSGRSSHRLKDSSVTAFSQNQGPHNKKSQSQAGGQQQQQQQLRLPFPDRGFPSPAGGPSVEHKVEDDDDDDDKDVDELRKELEVAVAAAAAVAASAEAEQEYEEENVVSANVVVGPEDDLGSFLHAMNLSSLVREFELEAGSGDGSQHLGGLLASLADDDNEEAPFPDLPEDHNHSSHVNSENCANSCVVVKQDDDCETAADIGKDSPDVKVDDVIVGYAKDNNDTVDGVADNTTVNGNNDCGSKNNLPEIGGDQ